MQTESRTTRPYGSRVARRFWLVLLAIPGLVIGAALAVTPRAASFLLGLVVTALIVPLVLAVVSYAQDPLFGRRDRPS